MGFKVSSSPIISVIVIAHDRKMFIRESIESVLYQNIPARNFEIIVVKNFRDVEIDTYLKHKGIKNIYTEALSLGEKCLIGISLSLGEIITFLEDDDIYLEGRLKRITEVFEDKDVVYYHNDHSIINTNGKILSGSIFNNLGYSYSTKFESLNWAVLRKLLNAGVYFNLSSIAIRKSILENKLQGLKELTVASDNFIFYVALDTGKVIYADSAKLTGYRVHPNNDSIFLSADSKIIYRAISFLKRDIFGYSTILKFVSNSILLEVLECRLMAAHINFTILDIDNKNAYQMDLIKAMRCCVKLRYNDMAVLIIVKFLSFLYPKLGHKIYLIYIKKKNLTYFSSKKDKKKRLFTL